MYNKVIGKLITILLFCLILFMALNSYKILVKKYPLETAESAHVITNEAVASGINIFNTDGRLYANVYGILGPISSLPFVYILDKGYVPTRLAGVFYLILSCVFIFITSKRSNIPINMSLAICLIFYSTNILYAAPYKPDHFGTFLFIMTIYIPYMCNFNNKSIYASIFIGILSFYCKAYYLLGFCLIISYFIIYMPDMRFRLITLSCAIISAFIALSLVFMPDYYICTIGPHGNGPTGTIRYSMYQFISFIVFYSIIILFSVYLKLTTKSNYNKLASDKRSKYPLYLLLVASPVLFWQSQHVGQYMTYISQMLSPIVILCFIDIAKGITLKNSAIISILTILPVLSYGDQPVKYISEIANDDYKNEWSQIENDISSIKCLLAAGPFAIYSWRKNTDSLSLHQHLYYLPITPNILSYLTNSINARKYGGVLIYEKNSKEFKKQIDIKKMIQEKYYKFKSYNVYYFTYPVNYRGVAELWLAK